MQVKVYSHGFFVYPVNHRDREHITIFSQRFTQTDKVKDPRTGFTNEVIKAVFNTSKEDWSEVGFLIRALPEFQEYWAFAHGGSLEIEIVPMYDPVPYKLTMLSKFSPRGQQPEAIEYTVEPGHIDRTLEAATGFGKTISAFFAMAELGVRSAAVMSATHLTTWTKCGGDYMAMRPGEVLVIKGSTALKMVIDAALQGLLVAKFLLFSAETIRNYIKEYESLEGSTYKVPPQDLWRVLGVGFLIRDESHESIHASARQVIYSHVPRIMFLSATLVSDDAFINKVYRYIFGEPGERWRSENNKHIAVRPLFYQTNRILLRNGKLKFNGPRGYSHVMFEKSILRNKTLLKDYLNFIDQTLRNAFIQPYQPGFKAIVLCSTVNMCEVIKKHFSAKYPQFTWGGFYDGAKAEELYERDVVISTPKGAGTGKDIPGLIALIQTIAVNSIQLNLQIMGRLRPIEVNGVKYAHMDPRYIYFVNNDIRKHLEYHKKRLMDVRSKCKDIKPVYSRFILGNSL